MVEAARMCSSDEENARRVSDGGAAPLGRFPADPINALDSGSRRREGKNSSRLSPPPGSSTASLNFLFFAGHSWGVLL